MIWVSCSGEEKMQRRVGVCGCVRVGVCGCVCTCKYALKGMRELKKQSRNPGPRSRQSVKPKKVEEDMPCRQSSKESCHSYQKALLVVKKDNAKSSGRFIDI